MQRQAGTGQPCRVDGCDSPVIAVELCNNHYRRFKRYGDPTAGRATPGSRTTEARFWGKVDKNGPGGCWLWTDVPNGAGYGTFRVGSKIVMAHRYVLTLAGQSPADSMTVDHLCRVRLCVNPAHLEEVTNAENLRRARRVERGRSAPQVAAEGA